MFFLLFADIIYDDSIDYAFVSKFQISPVDFYDSTAFFEARKEIILKELKKIESQSIEELIEKVSKNHDKYRDCRNIISSSTWKKFTLEDVTLLIEVIKKETLVEICKVLSHDYSGNRTGFPDLTIYNSKEVIFSEVKGKGDCLRDNQSMWINILLLSGAKVEICNVTQQ